jgi:hypothetical protein
MTISIKQILNEAVSSFKPDERVHVGSHELATPGNYGGGAELGTVTKTNGHGHTFVKTDSGKEHVFSADKSYRGSVIDGKQHVDNSMTHLKVRPIAVHEAGMAKRAKENAEYAVKKAAEEKHKSEQISQHAPIHKEILKKLKDNVGDEHLKNLGEQVHDFDRHGAYYGSKAESEIKDHPFKDLFHRITKNVRITNAKPETTAEHGITHFGTVGYSYQHPGGGSNGHDAYDFTRHTDGHIEVRKHVHTGDDNYMHPQWERKTTKVIK